MLNDAQIRKLQNKVGKKVQKNIKEREEKARERELANMVEMRKNIQRLQDANSDRGACVALWDGRFFTLNSKTNKVQFIPVSMEDRMALDEPEQINGKKYYFMKKDIYDFQIKALNFMSEHYAEIKIASVNIQKQNKPLESALMMSSIFETFQKEFPESSMFDFIKLYREFEKIMFASI